VHIGRWDVRGGGSNCTLVDEKIALKRGEVNGVKAGGGERNSADGDSIGRAERVLGQRVRDIKCGGEKNYIGGGGKGRTGGRQKKANGAWGKKKKERLKDPLYWGSSLGGGLGKKQAKFIGGKKHKKGTQNTRRFKK